MAFESFLEDFVFLDETSVEDGMGGTLIIYTEGAKFQMMLTLSKPQSVVVADIPTIVMFHSALIDKRHQAMKTGTKFKRVKDGATFKATSPPQEKTMPKFAMLPLMAFTVEAWHP